MEKEIYKVNPIIIYPECIIKTGEQDNWKDNDNMASHIKKNIFDVSTK